MSVMYFSPATKTFSGDPAPGAIAVPGVVYEELMEDQRAGKPLQMSADGSMPATVAGLLTLSGLQLAVAREVKTEAGPIHLALVGLGFDALLALTTAAPGDPNIPVYQATLVAVAQARAFLKGVLADPQVRAVQPGTDPGQGAGALKDLIWGKYKGRHGASSDHVRSLSQSQHLC